MAAAAAVVGAVAVGAVAVGAAVPVSLGIAGPFPVVGGDATVAVILATSTLVVSRRLLGAAAVLAVRLLAPTGATVPFFARASEGRGR